MLQNEKSRGMEIGDVKADWGHVVVKKQIRGLAGLRK